MVVISEMIARKYWPESSPLGRRIRPTRPEDKTWYTIEGGGRRPSREPAGGARRHRVLPHARTP